jgi:hypothetical protein
MTRTKRNEIIELIRKGSLSGKDEKTALALELISVLE